MAEKKRVQHLLDEPPIMVYSSLAVALGINHAIVFQQLHFLLNGQETAQNLNNYIDDLWWVYNSYGQWRDKYFQWLSESALKSIFLDLENRGLVLSRQGVKSKSDRRKWYTINYEAWDNFCLTIGQNLSDTDKTKSVRSNGQNLPDDSSNNTNKNTTETTESAAASASGDVLSNPDEKTELTEKEKAVKERQDQLFEIIALGSFGKPYAELNGNNGRAGRIRKELLKIKPDITPEYLKAGYQLYREENPDIKHNPKHRLKSPYAIIDKCEQALEMANKAKLKPRTPENRDVIIPADYVAPDLAAISRQIKEDYQKKREMENGQ